MNETKDRDSISTFEAAIWLRVNFKTCSNWFDKGMLPGFRTAGKHRRIYVDGIKEFATSRGMPLRLPTELPPLMPPDPVAKEPSPPAPSADLASIEISARALSIAALNLLQEVEKLRQAK